MHPHWAHVGRGAAGLGAAMGIGRFAYTPILPLMTTQAALTPQAAGALLLQAFGTALPAVAPGAVAALFGATLFGATFIGVSTMALAAGRLLGFPGAVALLTAGYSVGQILGPIAVTPLLRHDFSHALLAAALVVVLSAIVAGLLRFSFPSAGADPQPAATPLRRRHPTPQRRG